MSGEIFFDFGVKPVKKRKSQVRENQVESTENEEENENSEVRGGREKNHIWKRTDYTKASAVDAMGLYSSGKQNESDNSATRRKERKDEKQKKDEEEIISLSSEISKSEKDEKERKKRKKRKKKRSDESTNGREIDRKGRILKTKKKRRPFRPKDNDDEDDTGLEKRAVTISAPAVHSSSQPRPPVHVEENTKTALCAPSMVIGICESHGKLNNWEELIIIGGKFQESMLPDDDDMDDIKPPVSYKAMYEGGSESKYTDMEWSVELRYWIVLVVFISLLIIYRSLLPPLQCDTKFQ
uniref:Bm9604, isoform a n=1 Tax=Brugia malayi TaxID=6279 RepID=A0A1I9GF25_BRUMA|nr:Bm9604, isoform a [Brugia malayi]